ncbi:MAG: multifunctional CCA addition/repair protein [Pseudomonadota bacterium]|jgi:tRNA nucleotidyltransferase (CCA-adding enzyme)|nr:MAG: multifunctional CCA addition/repair protein [Pseudomonadota bacterium]
MQVYLVGGAVRDQLLGREARERDWVVVGGTAEELAAAGYRPVGRDFPVFLHPETQEEYALARRERKSGPGYRGFVTEFSPDITLEEDLLRRDLTINAIARDADGNYIDPYGGRADIEARVLRHVSPAFAEDPVRILRLARFAARFAPLGFTVHPDTLALARSMVEAGEADALVAERVWQETSRALGEARPDVFFQVLRDCGALKVVFPEVDRLFGVPQPEQWHPEVDTGVHVLLSLRRAAELEAPVTVRFAVLVHDLGKGTTPKEEWPKHLMHESRGLPLVEQLCARLKVPSAHRELALLTAREHTNVHRALQLRPDTVLKLLERSDAFRRAERFREMLLACQCDAQGRAGLEQQPYPQREYLGRAQAAAAAVQLSRAQLEGQSGPAIAQLLHRQRLQAIATLSPSAAR